MFPTALALLLCNMDRIVMSVAILPMSAEFGWAPGMQVRRLCEPSSQHDWQNIPADSSQVVA